MSKKLRVTNGRKIRLRANESRTPPEQAQTNAEAVLAVRDKTDAMTDTGWRRAQQLADGGELSTDVIQKMAQFKRHQSNTEFENYSDIPASRKGDDAETPWWEDNGTVAWLGWGGTAGVEWAADHSAEMSENTVRMRVNQRYGEGDTVDTPDGVGVVVDVLTESDEEAEIEASDDSPTYAVVVESEATGVGFYKASDLSTGEIDVDVENPEGDVAEMAANAESVDTFVANAVAELRGNQDGRFQWPESWRDSDTPARLIALKAWAGMKGSVDGCITEMRGNVTRPGAFCADFADRLYGTDYWRGDSWAPGD